ncbi:unnamed protein product [Rotaria sp. Silwood1]|nr:unnamed protein product [Rotaria sp. Silwood1]
MATISNFEILPEEITLHVFQYLSCADIIYGFYNLNTRFNSTITYFCHSMNLIGVTYKQFDCILSNILPQISSNIRSFVVNGNWASFISNKLHATRFELTLSSMFPNLYSLILECFIDTDLIIFLKEIRDLKYLVKLDIKRLTGRCSSELLKNILTANNGRLKSVLFDQDSIFLSLKTNDKNIICSNIEELTLNLIDCDMLGDLLKLIPNVRRLRISFGQSPGISTTTLMNVSPLIQLKDFELHSYGMFWEFSNIVDILSKMPSLHRLTLDLYTDDERLANGQNLVIVLPLSLVEIQLFILYYFSESPIKTDSLLATWPKHIPVSCWLNEPDQYTIIHTIPYNVHSILIPTAIATMMQFTEAVDLHLPRLKRLHVEGKCELLRLLKAAPRLYDLSIDFNCFNTIIDNESIYELLQQRIVCLEIFRLRDIHTLRLDVILKRFTHIRHLVLSVQDSTIFIDSPISQAGDMSKEEKRIYVCIKGPLSEKAKKALHKWLIDHSHTQINDAFAIDYQNEWIHFWV